MRAPLCARPSSGAPGLLGGEPEDVRARRRTGSASLLTYANERIRGGVAAFTVLTPLAAPGLVPRGRGHRDERRRYGRGFPGDCPAPAVDVAGQHDTATDPGGPAGAQGPRGSLRTATRSRRGPGTGPDIGHSGPASASPREPCGNDTAARQSSRRFPPARTSTSRPPDLRTPPDRCFPVSDRMSRITDACHVPRVPGRPWRNGPPITLSFGDRRDTPVQGLRVCRGATGRRGGTFARSLALSAGDRPRPHLRPATEGGSVPCDRVRVGPRSAHGRPGGPPRPAPHPGNGRYRRHTAQAGAHTRRPRPEPGKTDRNPRPWDLVQNHLDIRRSPGRICRALRAQFPSSRRRMWSTRPSARPSTSRGGGEPRRGREPRRRAQPRRLRSATSMAMSSDRPTEAKDRAVPGHGEGERAGIEVS